MNIQNLISEEMKMGKQFVMVKVNEKADENAFQMISYTKPLFIPPITASEINGERIFNYDVAADGFRRVDNLPSSLSPAEFLVFMRNLTGVVIQCRDYLLDPLNCLMSENYLYINPETAAARIIYLPLLDTVYSEAEISRQVYDLARNLSRRFSANDLNTDWQGVISHLWNMSENTTVYEAHEIYTGLCNKSKGKKVSPAPPPPPPVKPPPPVQAQPAQPMPETAPVKKEPEKKKPGLFGKAAETPKKKTPFGKQEPPGEPKPKKSFFGFGGKKPKPPKPEKKSLFGKSAPAPVVHDSQEVTEMLDEASVGGAVLYVLEQGAKTTMIPINKAVFVIGRNRSEVDYCFDGPNDKAISRVHMAIIFASGNYLVTDKNSSGGTLLDGRKLTPELPEIINHGSVIKIGRRELVFEII